MHKLSTAEYSKIYTSLFRIIASLISNQATAEDLVQETLLAAIDYAKYQKATPEEQKAILTRIARNKAVDWLRRKQNTPKLHQSTSSLQEEGHELASQEDAESKYALQEATSLVERELHKASSHKREALHAYFFEKKTPAEIAKRSSCTERTLYHWIHEFRASCRKTLRIHDWAT